MQSPRVYVIIINWNGQEHLDACFRSLLETTWTNAVFLLVDNASTDGSVEYVQTHFGDDARVAILALEENRGWSGGNNAGIEHARADGADYLFLLNNDTAIDPEAIQHLVEAMEQDPELGALAPRMVLFDQPEILNSTGLQLSVIGAAWDRGIGRFDGPRWHSHDPVVGVCGGACFLRVTALETTGLLPEDFEIYLDDLDLCLRIWSAGYTIRGCPEAVVRHKFSATMGTGARAHRKYYLNTRNRFRILLRHFPVRSAFAVLPRLFIGEVRALGRALLSGEVWRVLAHGRAWLSSLAYLPAALRFRRIHPGAGGLPPFWPFVVPSPLFCPEVFLPDQGWYPPIQYGNETLRPMARRAWVEISPGTLQASLVNCYPASGDAHIALFLDGVPLGTLKTASTVEKHYEVAGGTLVIVAESTFDRDDTGAPTDAGAWLQLTCNRKPLL